MRAGVRMRAGALGRVICRVTIKGKSARGRESTSIHDALIIKTIRGIEGGGKRCYDENKHVGNEEKS